jgi:hypothetical protein
MPEQQNILYNLHSTILWILKDEVYDSDKKYQLK